MILRIENVRQKISCFFWSSTNNASNLKLNKNHIHLTPSCWKGINAATRFWSTELRLMLLVDISCKVPGVVFRNVDVTALGNPSTITWAGKDFTAFTVKKSYNRLKWNSAMSKNHWSAFFISCKTVFTFKRMILDLLSMLEQLSGC